MAKAKIYYQTMNEPNIEDEEFTVRLDSYLDPQGKVAVTFSGGEWGELGFSVKMDSYDCTNLINLITRSMMKIGM